MKTFTLIAAAAIAASTATVASADNTFGFGDRLDNAATLDLGTVRTTSAGVVEIYDNANGNLGVLLGTEAVRAGLNTDVRVNVGHGPDADVIAVLKIDGQIVATQDYDID